MGAFGLASNNEDMTAAALDMETSLALTLPATSLIKVTLDRSRPDGGRYSFPFGHTSAMFSIAPVLTRYFGWKVGAPAYAAAVLTGLARIEDNRHYTSDVIAGATLGIRIGRARSYPFRGHDVSPIYDGEHLGLAVSS